MMKFPFSFVIFNLMKQIELNEMSVISDIAICKTWKSAVIN